MLFFAAPAALAQINVGTGLGRSCRVESSINLQTWSTVESRIPGNGVMVTRLYSIRSIPHRFFRAVKE